MKVEPICIRSLFTSKYINWFKGYRCYNQNSGFFEENLSPLRIDFFYWFCIIASEKVLLKFFVTSVSVPFELA